MHKQTKSFPIITLQLHTFLYTLAIKLFPLLTLKTLNMFKVTKTVYNFVFSK